MSFARVRNGLAAVVACAAALSGQNAKGFRPLSYTKFTLPNGLVTIVNEDHSAPIVAVDVWYHVGTKEERPGHQEVAHACEHLMFESSPHRAMDAKAFIESLGGTSTGSPGAWGATNEDMTHLFETVPTNYLETALWFEADRMAAPAFKTDSETFVLVRKAIAVERDQRVGGSLFGTDREAIAHTVFPTGHPYSWAVLPVLHPSTGLDATSPAEVRAFCVAHYVPSNAVLAVSGDADPAQVRRWVEKYFGSIPRGAAPHTVVPANTLTTEKRLVLEDARARAPQMHVTWTGAGFSSRDKMPLQALAFILQGDSRSGLRKLLINDRRLATSVDVNNFDNEAAGYFQIDVTALPTAALTTIEQLIDSVVSAARDTPPQPSQLIDFQSRNRFLAAYSLQIRAGRVDTLAQGQSWAGDPILYAKQVDQADALTPHAVREIARKYLTPGQVVMSLIPAGKLDMISKPDVPYVRVLPSTSPVP